MKISHFLSWLALLIGLLTTSLALADESDCNAWLSDEFYQGATAKDISKCLSSGKSVDDRTNEGETPLHLAARSAKDASLILKLLTAGADTSKTTAAGYTALHMAAMNPRSPASIPYLLLWGSEVDARVDGGGWCQSKTRKIYNCGQTALHIASSSSGRGDLVAALLLGGATIEAYNESERTPLDLAARYGGISEVQLLLRAGADVDAKDAMSERPLHAAAKRALKSEVPQGDNVLIIKALLKNGSSPDSERQDGTTPLILSAYHAKDPEELKMLLKASKKPCYEREEDVSVLSGMRISGKKTSMEDVYWNLHDRCAKKE